MIDPSINPFENERGAVAGLTNVFTIAIVVSDDGEEVLYQYITGEKGVVKILYDKEGQPFFNAKDGCKYYIDDFMRNS